MHLFIVANIAFVIFLDKILKKTDRQSVYDLYQYMNYHRILQRFRYEYVLFYYLSIYDIEVCSSCDFSIFPTNSVFVLRVSPDVDFLMAGVIETYVKWNPISGKCSWAFIFLG